jgi:hypothetical protein
MFWCDQLVSPGLNVSAQTPILGESRCQDEAILVSFGGVRNKHRSMSVYKFIIRAFAVASYLLGAVALTATVTRASAETLESLHARILRQPNNTELNLRFGELAERAGYLRWALAAYERVVLNDPANLEGQRGLTRVRRALQPNFTLATLQFGAIYETHPRYYLPSRPEFQGFGSIAVIDERKLGDMRWRTDSVAAVIAHAHETDLTYGIAGFDTGPVIDVYPGWSVHTALGANAAYFDRHFYFAEGAASAAVQTTFGPVLHSLLLRGAYRSYDEHFPSTQGVYAEVRARWAVPDVTGPGSVLILSPWYLWSDISGSTDVVSPIITDLQPGAYDEYGGRVEWVQSLASWVALSAHVSVWQRNYRHDVVAEPGVPEFGQLRRDFFVSPGGSLIFPGLFAYRTDLRLDYRYLTNDSNDPTKDFHDHIVSLSVIKRFDPTRPWSPTPAPAAAPAAVLK